MASIDQKSMGKIPNLIFDIGMSEGNDSAFYLKKGFQVIGVEADLQMYLHLRERFKKQIEVGLIKILNFAASESFGDVVEFFHHDIHQGLSGLSHDRCEFIQGSYSRKFISTINWSTLIAQQGVPYYMKIDIEGQETCFLKGIGENPHLMPEYLSVECHTLAPVELLWDLGYRLFKLVDQNPPGGFVLPKPQREGLEVKQLDWTHSSGPFGRDLAEKDWLNFEDFKLAFEATRHECAWTWFDCHVWMPDNAASNWTKANVADERDRFVIDNKGFISEKLKNEIDKFVMSLRTPAEDLAFVPNNFDARLYLEKNIDVFNAKTDPYTHYRNHGCHEKRQW